tara:strand:+ start:2143 stop:2307 length:165 start_codon:yes stop_codon:yes gene_type:complete
MAPQIERLKRDSKELKHFLFRLEKEGNTEHAHRMRAKLEYLNSKISDIEDEDYK